MLTITTSDSKKGGNTMLNSLSERSLKNISTDEKLDFIDRVEENDYFAKGDLKTLDVLSQDGDDEVRSRVAEVLVFSNTVEAEKILIRLLNDKEELVRINACDSLCTSTSKDVITLLIEKAKKDKSSLVRAYAVMSATDISKNIGCKEETLELIMYLFSKEKVNITKISYYRSFLLLGQKCYLSQFLEHINDRFYRNRCTVANLLKDLITDKIFSKFELAKVKNALESRLKIETSLAVKNSIEKTIYMLPKEILE